MSEAALDTLTVPLPGLALIEASAGTGKTYTINRLHLRLVMERGLGIDQILVVTYTVAATDQLRKEIRALLVEALHVLGGKTTKDAILRELVARCDREQATQRITRALREFDGAAIFTIHGFCQRVLVDGAFESGMPFDSEVLADEATLRQEIADDFWRRTFHDASPLLASHLLRRRQDPGALLDVVAPHLGRHDLRVLVPDDPGDLAALEATCLAAFAAAQAAWRRDEVERLLIDHPALRRNVYKTTSIPRWIARADAYLAAELPDLKPFERFERLTTADIRGNLKGKGPAPAHPFFAACEAMLAAVGAVRTAYEARLAIAQRDLLAFCRAELVARKQRLQAQSFDDLLTQLAEALHGPRGARLAASIRERWPAALIDEFQDTDPVQYGIFRAIYDGTDAPVFLVGDPKQAIYSFRGADIFAYLAARRGAGRRFPLDVNWRSDPALITAVNAVFAGVHRPFVAAEIEFLPARPAPRDDREVLAIAGEPPEPLRIWSLASNGPRVAGKGVARQKAARATAAAIARLLEQAARGEATLGGRPLEGGDVAVLVRKHREGALIRRELLRLGVPSVQQAQDSVFVTREAAELERVLAAVADPGRPALVRAALATEMLGVDAASLVALGASDVAWTVLLEAFHRHRQAWRERGLSAMLRGLFDERGVPARLLAYQDGERRLTNVLHLAELLQAAETQRGGGPESLLAWMAERRQADVAESEEQQLRLESDEQLVKIVTIHKSKGLEYPIVFCPFVWDGRLWSDDNTNRRPFAFHDSDDDDRPCLALDLVTLKPKRELAMREELAENLRLLYVALTRAKHRLTLVTGRIGDAGTSPLAWLLHAPADVAMTEMGRHVRDLGDAAMLADLVALAARSEGTIRVEPLPEDDGVPYRGDRAPIGTLEARRLARPVPRAWSIASFSALTAGHGDEAPDHDATRWSAPLDGERPARDVFGFPRGARAGSCLHRIFELHDFQARDARARERLVARELRVHGLDVSWAPVVADMVERVLTTPLDAAGRVRLADVPAERRLAELEFYYPLERLEARVVREALATHGFGTPALRDAVAHLPFEAGAGFMKGFVDLVFEADGRFWILDWKSNWLGAALADYAPAQLETAMAREAYWLQYLVYTVMLHRLLRLRLGDAYDYDRHVGGVFYVFLRGVDPAAGPGAGVFHDRPTRALVEALDAHIGAGLEAVA